MQQIHLQTKDTITEERYIHTYNPEYIHTHTHMKSRYKDRNLKISLEKPVTSEVF